MTSTTRRAHHKKKDNLKAQPKEPEPAKPEQESTESPPEPVQPRVEFTFTKAPQYLRRTKEAEEDKLFQRFINQLSGLSITIPLLEAITATQPYGKFVKELVSKKRPFKIQETMALTEQCCSIIQRTPTKKKDPGSFTIPCSIGKASFTRTLCDLGASVKLMPLSVYKQLNIGELEPTSMTL